MHDRDRALALARFARSVTLNLIKDWPTDKLTHQAAPTDNHVLWTVGHLAGSDAYIAKCCGAPPLEIPESLAKATGMGSKPSPRAADYPPLPEALRVLEKARKDLERWFETAAPAQLSQSLKEKTEGFADDPVDLLAKMAWHEGWHAGQIASLRKSLGLPPVIG